MLRGLPRSDGATSAERVRSYLYDRGGGHLHRGIDLGAREGSPVHAVQAGVVEHATNAWKQGFTGYGKVVVVRSPDGRWQLYAHLKRPLVQAGQQVVGGELIGEVGRTKFTREDHDAMFAEGGAHLHFEVAARKYPMHAEDERVDPVAYLEAGRVHPLTGKWLTPVTETEEPGQAAPPFVEPPSRGCLLLLRAVCPHCSRSLSAAATVSFDEGS